MFIDLEAMSRGWMPLCAGELDRNVEAGHGEQPMTTHRRGSWLVRLLKSIRHRSELRRKSREFGRLDARTLKDIGLTPDLWCREATLGPIREARP